MTNLQQTTYCLQKGLTQAMHSLRALHPILISSKRSPGFVVPVPGGLLPGFEAPGLDVPGFDVPLSGVVVLEQVRISHVGLATVKTPP